MLIRLLVVVELLKLLVGLVVVVRIPDNPIVLVAKLEHVLVM